MKNFTKQTLHYLTTPSFHFRNKLNWFCCMLFLFLNMTSFAQVFYDEPCGYSSSTSLQTLSPCVPTASYSGSIDPNDLSAYPPVSYNIQIWINNKDDGTNDRQFTFAEIKEKIDLLNQQFALANICFNLVAVDTVNNSSTYGTRAFNEWAINNGYYDSQAINLYLYQGTGRGSASGIQAEIEIDSFFDDSGINGHEVGHLFGLRHTHGSGYDPNATWWTGPCEHVTRDPNDPDFNAYCQGDHVLDTNSVPDFTYEHKYEKADSLITNHGYTRLQAWNAVGSNFQYGKYIDYPTMQYIGTGTDCQGIPFTITPDDVTNLMAYSDWSKMDHFSVGQGIRMREYIDIDPQKFNAITNNEGVDLVIYDGLDDVGLEPNTITDPIWHSTDIWVRNQPDGLENQQHQDLHYGGPQDWVYVYVRITNQSCFAFSGNDGDLKLYWAKGGLTQSWPTVWTGSSSGGLPTGDDVGTKSIPTINPGESVILVFPWQPHNPDIYENAFPQKPWMFCFLARIESAEDQMTFSEGTNVALNTRNNNNIAYKNTTVINTMSGFKSGSVFAGNLANETPIIADIRFYTNTLKDDRIWQDAEVEVVLDDPLWTHWQQNGGEAENVRVIDEEEHVIRLTGNNARLHNIYFGPDEWGVLTLGANFLIDEVDMQENYALHIAQLSSGSQEVTGGFTYDFRRDNEREYFQAHASSDFQGNTLKLTADDINEQATYNWYDTNGDLVYTGKDYTLSNTISESYQLEVIAEADGHKDYHHINTSELRKIQSISPNPASTKIDVNYFVGNSNSAYLRITSVATGSQNNYLINAHSNTQTIDLNAYPTGIYIVSLVCQGNIIDSKNLIIE